MSHDVTSHIANRIQDGCLVVQCGLCTQQKIISVGGCFAATFKQMRKFRDRHIQCRSRTDLGGPRAAVDTVNERSLVTA